MRLSELYLKITPAERAELAKKAGLPKGYLYQLATRWDGRKATVPVLQRLLRADARLTIEDLVAEFSEPAAKKAGA